MLQPHSRVMDGPSAGWFRVVHSFVLSLRREGKRLGTGTTGHDIHSPTVSRVDETVKVWTLSRMSNHHRELKVIDDSTFLYTTLFLFMDTYFRISIVYMFFLSRELSCHR